MIHKIVRFLERKRIQVVDMNLANLSIADDDKEEKKVQIGSLA